MGEWRMAKGKRMRSILQGREKRCYITGKRGVLEKHHIYFGIGMRQISEQYGFWVYLTAEQHRGTDGVHGKEGHALDLRLKQDCQRRFEEGHSRAEFMAIIGRNYLAEDTEKKPQLPAEEGGFVLLDVEDMEDMEG